MRTSSALRAKAGRCLAFAAFSQVDSVSMRVNPVNFGRECTPRLALWAPILKLTVSACGHMLGAVVHFAVHPRTPGLSLRKVPRSE